MKRGIKNDKESMSKMKDNKEQLQKIKKIVDKALNKREEPESELYEPNTSK